MVFSPNSSELINSTRVGIFFIVLVLRVDLIMMPSNSIPPACITYVFNGVDSVICMVSIMVSNPTKEMVISCSPKGTLSNTTNPSSLVIAPILRTSK